MLDRGCRATCQDNKVNVSTIEDERNIYNINIDKNIVS